MPQEIAPQPLDILLLDELFKQTTQGDWKSSDEEDDYIVKHRDKDGWFRVARFNSWDGNSFNSEFTAAIHNAWPQIKDRLRELNNELLKYRKILSYVPSEVAIKAKEHAGYGNLITPTSPSPSVDAIHLREQQDPGQP